MFCTTEEIQGVVSTAFGRVSSPGNILTVPRRFALWLFSPFVSTNNINFGQGSQVATIWERAVLSFGHTRFCYILTFATSLLTREMSSGFMPTRPCKCFKCKENHVKAETEFTPLFSYIITQWKGGNRL